MSYIFIKGEIQLILEPKENATGVPLIVDQDATIDPNDLEFTSNVDIESE